MHKHKMSRIATSESSERDSKYTVAQILSSMTDTARQSSAITPVSFSEGVVPTFPTSVSSGALLTPSTLANLERTFDLAIQAENNTNSSSAASTSAIQTTESGFIPPVVNPIVIDPAVRTMGVGVKREYDPRWEDDLSSCSSTDPEWNPSTSKRSRKEKVVVPNIDPDTFLMQNSRRPTGPRKERRNEHLTGDDLQKREVRRERNKLAAAKCRQKRVEQTNVLINETEHLEEDNAELENEISRLMKQKDELQFLLDAHKPACQGLHRQQPLHQPAISTSAVSYPLSRPSTLPLRTTQAPATTAPVSITTPSSGLSFSHMGLDALIDGHTGLTPLTAGPVSLPTVVASTSSTSCGSQMHRNSSDSNNSPSNTSPNSSSQLISL